MELMGHLNIMDIVSLAIMNIKFDITIRSMYMI